MPINFSALRAVVFAAFLFFRRFVRFRVKPIRLPVVKNLRAVIADDARSVRRMYQHVVRGERRFAREFLSTEITNPRLFTQMHVRVRRQLEFRSKFFVADFALYDRRRFCFHICLFSYFPQY